MSGPKVVHVVTREEVEATCRRWLLLVSEAADDLLRHASHFGLSNATLQAQVAKRRTALDALMRPERWLDLQKEAPRAIEYFRFEGERLRSEAVATAAAKRSKRRRMLDAARSVADSLAAAGQPVPAPLFAVIGGAMTAVDADLDAMQGVVEASIASLAPAPLQRVSAQQRDLAARLDAGGQVPTLAQWLKANAKADPQAERLDALLSELASYPTRADIGGLAAQAISIAAEPSPDRRALLTDSLVLDVGRRLRDERAIEAAAAKAAAVRAELAAFPSEAAQACGKRLEAAIDDRDAAGMQAGVTEGEALLDAGRRQAAAVARRQAVLGGLASLGYEIREGMEAAWAKEGRIVVRRPGTEDYGVELAAPADASKLQARLVGSDRPSAPRDVTRDKDQETIWCGQFDQLRTIVASGGGRIEIERALAPGEQAVKTVSMPGAAVTAEVPETSRPQARALSRS